MNFSFVRNSLRQRLSILLILFAVTAIAQTGNDYASILASTDWGWQNHNGVYFGKASFDDLYGKPQRISIAMYPDSTMATMLYDKERSKQGTDTLAAEAGATVAINGSYFNMSNRTSCTALWIDGVEIATTLADEYSRCNGIVGFKDGILSIEPYSNATTASQLAAWGKKYDAFVATGPLIRMGGVSMDANIGGEGFCGPHPRSMIGKRTDGTVYMIVVEGRMEDAIGFTMENMVALAEDLDITDAINLDGGGSSTLWVSGTGVINRPSGGSVRNVPNIIIACSRTDRNTDTNGSCTHDTPTNEPAHQDADGDHETDN